MWLQNKAVITFVTECVLKPNLHSNYGKDFSVVLLLLFDFIICKKNNFIDD